MHDKRFCLKVKIKSLAAEAKIIRHEENKHRGELGARAKGLLADHRKGIVRNEARLTQLAYGFLRGRTLDQIEKDARTPPDMDRVWKMVERYGPCLDIENNETSEQLYARRKAMRLAFDAWKQS